MASRSAGAEPTARDPADEAWVAAAEAGHGFAVVEIGTAPAAPSFASRYPGRYRLSTATPAAAREALAGSTAGSPALFVRAPAAFLMGPGLEEVVRPAIALRGSVRFLATAPEGGRGRPTDADRHDLSLVRSLPGTTVVAPADGPSARTAIEALAAREGPCYLRLPEPTARTCTDGSFVLGRALERRAGADLAIVAYGSALVPALGTAGELERVGVSARVLDVASLKPFDQASIVRAARETGAILVVEPAPLPTGVGTLVATITAENHPIPIRRIGPGEPDGEPEGLVGGPLGVPRLVDAAWELLRLRGKVE